MSNKLLDLIKKIKVGNREVKNKTLSFLKAHKNITHLSLILILFVSVFSTYYYFEKIKKVEAAICIDFCTVTASAGTGGSVSPTSQSIVVGDYSSISVSPNSGYLFNAMGGTCPNKSYSAGTISFGPVNSNCNISVSFVAAATCSSPCGTISSGSSCTAYASSAPVGTSCTSETRTCTNGSLSGSYTYGSCSAGCNVTPFPPMSSGSWVTAFAQSLPSGSCTSESRTCTNGSLSGSYGFANCTTGCTGTIFGNIPSGASGTAYQSSSVPYGSTCTSEVRTCSSGSFSGSYPYTSCTVQPAANCTGTAWGTVNHGNSVTAYSTSSVPYGSSCSSQTRTCNNGSLSGSYAYTSCTVDPAASCTGTPWGTVAHGFSGTAYADNYPYGSCTSQTRTCTNGSMSGSYAYTSCNPGCTGTPWGSVYSGYSATAYSMTGPLNACSSNSQVRTCTSGTLSGSSGYQYSYCYEPCYSTPWGTVSNGFSGTAYASSLPAGACSSQTRSCSNGSFSGSYGATSCTPGCTGTPWGSVSSGFSGTAYASSTADVCSSQTRTCSSGSMSGTYTATSCTVNSYSITFNSNGGTAVSTITQQYGTSITPPANPTRTGYTFAGWSPALAGTMPSGGQSLTATWNVNTYGVTWNSATGGTSSGAATCTYGSSVTVTCTPSAGYSSTCPASFTCSTSNSFTPTFSINTYTVTFNGNGNDSGSTASQNIVYGNSAVLNSNGYGRTGYTFNGWNTASNGSGTSYANGANYTMGAGNVTLYAQWSDSTAPTAPGDMTTSWARDHYVNTNFVASTSGATDSGSGVRGYRLCRSNDNAGGCSVWTTTGEHAGTSETVSGADLPSNGAYRYYYWYAYDNNGNQSSNSNGVYIRMDSDIPTYNSTTFTGCNYESGNNCYVKNGATFYVNISHTDNNSGSSTQYFELSKDGVNRGTWDGATGNIKSYANPYGVSNGGYYTSFSDGGGMEGTGYMDIQNAQCIQTGNCNNTALGKWQVVASSGASRMYGVTVYMYDGLNNGVGYTDTGKYVYLDNTAPVVSSPTDGGANTDVTSLTFTPSSAPSDAYSGVSECYAQIDVNNTDGASLAMSDTAVGVDGGHTWTGSRGNTYYYRYYCVDRVGNSSGWSAWSDGIYIYNNQTLTYTAGANGTISGTTSQVVNYGTNGTAVTAVPNSGYYFVNWSDGSTANPRTDTNVTSNISVTANFATSYLSCKDILDRGASSGSGVYRIDPDNVGGNDGFQVYCDMTTDGGGWTLAMKIDGSKTTFNYDSTYWTDGGTYQTNSPGFDTTEAKLLSFNTMNFTQVMVETRDYSNSSDDVDKMVINQTASSLHSLISGGVYTSTSNDRAYWTSLMDDTANLQPYCNQQGFNLNITYAKSRIGIAGNNENDCGTSDTMIGLGLQLAGHPYGNYPAVGGGLAGSATPAYGWIFIRNIPIVSTPVASPVAGSYSLSRSVTLSSDAGASIYYTTNGTIPTTSSTLYSGAITVNATATIKAIAVKSGYGSSSILSAAYDISYPLTYTAGANGTISGTTSQTVPYNGSGSAVTAVPNSGYYFVNWSDGSTTNPRTDTGVTTSISVTANFSPVSYSITFNSNGGTAVGTITQNYGTTITPPANPTRTGYTFTGWSPAVPATMPVGGAALTAQWSINSYTLTFDGNSATGGSTSSQSLVYNTPTALNSNGFTRTGYTFNGWNTASNGSGTAYANGASYTIGAGNVTLYAQWLINTQAALSITSTSVTYPNTLALTTSGGSGTGAVTYVVNSGTCTIVGSTLTPTSAGSCSVTATKAAEANYPLPVSSSATTITINKANQLALTVTNINGTYPTGLSLSATGGSGTGAVTYALVAAGTAGCAVTSGGSLTFTSAGTCTVNATKAADTNYNSITSSNATVTISMGDQQPLNFSGQTITYPAAFSALSATGGSGGGAVTYAVTSAGAGCSIAGTTLSYTSAGTCGVTATKAADTNYKIVSSAQASFIINKSTPTVSVTNSPQNYTGSGITPAVSGSVAGSVTNILVGGAASQINAGTYAVTANLTPTDTTNYNSLTNSSAGNFIINKINQNTLTLSAQTVTYPAAFVALSTTGGSGGGAVTYAVTSAGAGCSIAGTTLSYTSAGTCGVTATKAADTNYNVASSTQVTFTISKSPQPVLTVTNIAGTYPTGFNLNTTGGSGAGAVTYALVAAGTANCAVTSGGAITFSSAGTCTVNATKAGDTNYNPVTSANTTITINKGSQASLVFSGQSISYTASFATLSTTGGSGTGAVTYAVTSVGAGCSITGNTLNYATAGTCGVTATKDTDTNYLPISSLQATFIISKSNQPALLVTSTTGTYPNSVALTTSGGAGVGAITYAVSNGTATGCSVVGSTLSFASAGTCNVTATKAGDTNYNILSSTSTPVTISLGTQNPLTITSTSGIYGFTLNLTTSGGSGSGAVTYAVTSAGTASCAVAGSVLSYVSQGTCTVTATKAGDTGYNSIASTATTITVNPFPTLTQSGYKLFSNTDSLSAGSSLTSQNSSVTLSNSRQPFRLRLLVHVADGGAPLPQNGASFKLQYAQRSGTCDASFVGETYQDVDWFTPIAFYDNPYPNDKVSLVSDALDPKNASYLTVGQTYVETNIFSNSVSTILAGQDGEWDFSLADKSSGGTTYCLRAIRSDGSTLTGGYNFIPEITTAIRKISSGGSRLESSTSSGTTSGGTGQTGGGIIEPLPQCSDGINNGDADGLIDALDPQCHANGNINNQYVPTHNSESVAPVINSGGGGKGGGGGDLGYIYDSLRSVFSSKILKGVVMGSVINL